MPISHREDEKERSTFDFVDRSNNNNNNLQPVLKAISATMYPTYPPELNKAQEQYLLQSLKDWSIANGLAVRPAPSYVATDKNPGEALAGNAPVTLFPSLFPKVCFEQAKSVAKAYNELYSAIASDENWLTGIVEE